MTSQQDRDSRWRPSGGIWWLVALPALVTAAAPGRDERHRGGPRPEPPDRRKGPAAMKAGR